MKFILILSIVCGYLQFSLSQSTCDDMTRGIVRQCVDSFNTSKNDMSGNTQLTCDAAKTFKWCVKDHDKCFMELDIYNRLTEVDNIIMNYPCSAVIGSASSVQVNYLSWLLITVLFCYLV